MSPLNSDSRKANAPISDSLANSAGWSWNGPNANHACAPFDCEPRGDTTSTSMAVVAP